jgi:ATP-dependent Clp protease ATP-binding subunit ClpC
MLKELADQLKEQAISLKVDESAKEKLVNDGYDAAYGARPLRRAIQKLIEDPLAEDLLSGRQLR